MKIKMYDRYTPNYIREALVSKLNYYHSKDYSSIKPDLRVSFDYYSEKYIFHWLYRQLNVHNLSLTIKPELALNKTLEQEKIFHNRTDCLYLLQVLAIASISIDDFKFDKENLDPTINEELDWGSGLSTYSSTITSLCYLSGLVGLEDIIDVPDNLYITIQEKVIQTLIRTYTKCSKAILLTEDSIIDYLLNYKPNNRVILL